MRWFWFGVVRAVMFGLGFFVSHLITGCASNKPLAKPYPLQRVYSCTMDCASLNSKSKKWVPVVDTQDKYACECIPE